MKYSISGILILVFIGLFLMNGWCQEPGMWNITDRDGLPSMTVYDMAQDSQGFMWLGTAKGICRFDGREFKYYKSNALKDSEILKIRVGPLGRIWFNNLSGQLFYINHDRIENFNPVASSDSAKKADRIWDFEFLNQKLYYFFREEIAGKDVFRLAMASIDSIYQGALFELSSEIWSSITPFYKNKKAIYFTASSQILSADNLELHYQINWENQLEKKVVEKLNSTILLKENNDLFFVNYKQRELLVVGENTKKSFYLPFLKNGVNRIVKVEEDYWMLSRKGLAIYSIPNDSFIQKRVILENVATNDLLIDTEGNKWIATTGKGVFVVTADQTLLFNKDNFNLPSDEIYSLEYNYTNQDLLIGFDNGRFAALNSKNDLKSFELNEQGRIVDILVDHKGYHWLGTDIRMIQLGKDYDVVNRYNNNIKTILQSEDTAIWIGRFDGVRYMEYEDLDSFYRLGKKAGSTRILSNRTYALYEDFENKVWIGTTNGIFTYAKELKKFEEDNVQVGYNTSSIAQSLDASIWIGTRGDGLLKIKNDKILFRWNEKNGLASNTVNKVFASNDHLWIGTDNGVNKLNLNTQDLEWINTADGLPSLEVNDIIVVKDQVWIGTPRGLVNFSSNANHINATPPPIYLTDVKIEEKDTILQDDYTLKYDQNSIQLSYLGIAYNAKGDISYEYRLSGVDKNWVTTKSRMVRYPNLPAGDYSFEVFAINDDQIKSRAAAKVNFTIRQAWWKTNWFYALCFLIFAGIIFALVYFWIKRRRQEEFFRNHVSELKTQALRSQMNPHFIFNALNAIQQFLTTNDREQAMHYLGQFAILIRLIFEQSQREKITLEEELEFLNLYLSLEKLRFMDAVKIELEVDPALLERQDEIDLPALVIQPIIENSFKHGFLYQNKEGLLRIAFSFQDDYIHCSISDNGIGRKKAAELGEKNLRDRPSSGLKTARDRLKINNKRDIHQSPNDQNIEIIDVKEANGKVNGTLVKVRIYCPDLQYVD